MGSTSAPEDPIVTAVLLVLIAAAGGAVAYLAAKAMRRARERADLERRLVDAERDLAVARAVVDERDAELARLHGEREQQSAQTSGQTQRLELLSERLRRVEEATRGAARESDAARAGTARIESQLLGFTRRIANPQSRGAFGEEALRNQLELLGLSQGRDFERQVTTTGGGRRIDYVVRLRGATVGIDPKFALDPDLDGLSAAVASADQPRLAEYARKLIARARELSAKEYWAGLGSSPSFVLMYVPVEGAQEVLRALPNFSHEKFATEHGVYIVTPLQLGTTLGVIADVAHLSRRERELDTVAAELTGLAQELSRFCDVYHRHGRQIAAVARSYDEGAAMLSARGGIGRVARRSMGFARRVFSLAEPAEIPVPRDDCGAMGDAYRELAAERPPQAA